MCFWTNGDNREGKETRNQKVITWSENKEKQSYIRFKIFNIFQKVGGIKVKVLQQ